MQGLDTLLLCGAVFIAGALFGMVIMALCATAGRNNDDDNMDDSGNKDSK